MDRFNTTITGANMMEAACTTSTTTKPTVSNYRVRVEGFESLAPVVVVSPTTHCDNIAKINAVVAQYEAKISPRIVRHKSRFDCPSDTRSEKSAAPADTNYKILSNDSIIQGAPLLAAAEYSQLSRGKRVLIDLFIHSLSWSFLCLSTQHAHVGTP
eukprot:scaffold5222_cov293-Pinguiococcus_pyrenoidosus.AAC.4